MNDPTDLNDVRSFVIATRLGSLSAAAAEMQQPVSTVSRALTRLEHHFGVLLVRRGARGLSLTDDGKEYLVSCKRALRTLREAGAQIEGHKAKPSGVLKLACPITMARDIIAPLLTEIQRRYPELRLEIEPYASGWDQEPREDVDVFFKVRAPKDSLRNVRVYPGTGRGLFAASSYLAAAGSPQNPVDLTNHACTGTGIWKFTRGQRSVTTEIAFRTISSDPYVNMCFVQQGLGIGSLPLYMAKWPEKRKIFVPVLPLWKPEPIVLCALYTGQSRLTPKVHLILDLLSEYVGTDRDPRLKQAPSKGIFTEISLPKTFSP